MEQHTQAPVFYKPSEVAQLLRISTRSLYSLLASGRLGFIRLSPKRRYRVPAACLRKLEREAERQMGGGSIES